MVAFARRAWPNETGSALVGTCSDDGLVATVVRVMPREFVAIGGPRDCLVGNMPGERDYFARLFQRSRGRVFFAGAWHSHPGGAARLSEVDWYAAQRIAETPAAECPVVILAVLALATNGEASLGVNVYSRKDGRIPLLRVELRVDGAPEECHGHR